MATQPQNVVGRGRIDFESIQDASSHPLVTQRCLTNPESEVVEGVFVDDVQFPNESKGKLHHRANVHVLSVMFLVV